MLVVFAHLSQVGGTDTALCQCLPVYALMLVSQRPGNTGRQAIVDAADTDAGNGTFSQMTQQQAVLRLLQFGFFTMTQPCGLGQTQRVAFYGFSLPYNQRQQGQ